MPRAVPGGRLAGRNAGQLPALSTSRDVAGKSWRFTYTNQPCSAARSCAKFFPPSTCDGRRDAIRLPVVSGRISDWFIDGRSARHLPSLHEDRQCSHWGSNFDDCVPFFGARQGKPADVAADHSTACAAPGKSFAITSNGTGRFALSAWIRSTVDFHAYRTAQSGERSQVTRTTDHIQRESLSSGIHTAEIGIA